MTDEKIFEAGPDGKDKRLDVFLCQQLPDFTRSKILHLIKSGHVQVDGQPPQKSGQKLKCGQVIKVAIPTPKTMDATPQNLPLDIVFEDDDLAVINKPQGMVVHAGSGNWDGTLVNALVFHIKNLSGINGVLRPGIVHRLDKNTAGLLVVAKNDFAHAALAKQIAQKTAVREYLAIVAGTPKQHEGVIETHIARHPKNRKIMAVCQDGEGKKAITHFCVLRQFNGAALVKFNLKTGRTHQIRVHAKEVLHCPLCGDVEYGGTTPKVLRKADTKSLGQYLVAKKLEFVHPRTGKPMSFEIELPEFFEVLLRRLEQ